MPGLAAEHQGLWGPNTPRVPNPRARASPGGPSAGQRPSRLPTREWGPRPPRLAVADSRDQQAGAEDARPTVPTGGRRGSLAHGRACRYACTCVCRRARVSSALRTQLLNPGPGEHGLDPRKCSPCPPRTGAEPGHWESRAHLPVIARGRVPALSRSGTADVCLARRLASVPERTRDPWSPSAGLSQVRCFRRFYIYLRSICSLWKIRKMQKNPSR